MDFFTLATGLIQAIAGSTIIFFVFSFFRQKKKDNVNFEIKNLEAKMANLRMILKAKVKKKSNFLRAHATTAIKQGDPFDVIATELAENPFDSNDDFEKYFTLSKQLNTFLKFDLVKQQTVAAKTSAATDPSLSKPAAEANADFMTADVKNEFTIIKTIHEMINLSSILKVKIDHYNSTNLKKPLRPVQPIEFASVIDIQKIFSTEKQTDSKSDLKSAA